MHTLAMNTRPRRRLHTFDVAPNLGSTKLPAAIIFAVLTLTVLALLLLFALPAQAQTEAALYNFTGGSDGATPESRLTPDTAGNFYGATEGGGLGYGTVFELSPNGSGGWNETVLYSFTGGADGANPAYAYVIFDSVGNLYGTTALGGTGYGVVFELSPSGTGWTEKVLYNFCSQFLCLDGFGPMNGLVRDSAGNLYGTTAANNPYIGGVVFELSPSAGGWTEQVIYSPETESAIPGLTMDAAGNIFGVMGSSIFELYPNGSGGWNRSVIHSFTNPKDGSDPIGPPVLDQNGNLYGTTAGGGGKGYGTVYKLSPGTNGKWKAKVLHNFTAYPKDGSEPLAGVVLDAAGNIYGSTSLGGELSAGTVFELVAPVGTGKSYKEKILWIFNNTDGKQPYGSLVLDSAGNFYGTTSNGGSSGYGVVFELTP